MAPDSTAADNRRPVTGRVLCVAVANWGVPLPGRDERVTDEARRSALFALGEHGGEARLTRAEVDERARLVLAAERNDQLDAVFADLPQPHPRFSARPATGFDVLAGLAAFAVLVTALTWITGGPWLPMVIAVAVHLGAYTVHGTIAGRRLAALRDDPHERQRRQPRPQRYDTDGLRLGQTERVAAAEALIVHAAAGLPMEEYHAYADRLPAVRTRGELKALLGHLPPPDPELADTVWSPPGEYRRPWGLPHALTVSAVVPGLPAAITMWARYGQWHWLPVWAAVLVLLSLALRRHLRPPATAPRGVPGMVG